MLGDLGDADRDRPAAGDEGGLGARPRRLRPQGSVDGEDPRRQPAARRRPTPRSRSTARAATPRTPCSNGSTATPGRRGWSTAPTRSTRWCWTRLPGRGGPRLLALARRRAGAGLRSAMADRWRPSSVQPDSMPAALRFLRERTRTADARARAHRRRPVEPDLLSSTMGSAALVLRKQPTGPILPRRTCRRPGVPRPEGAGPTERPGARAGALSTPTRSRSARPST